jgi:general secretion pathway protein G
MTILELLVTLAIVGLLTAISATVYASALEKSKITRAIVEISGIEKAIGVFEIGGALPSTLDEIGWGNVTDPWGNPYEYLRFEVKPNGTLDTSKARKDRFLVPLNSTYDLYSMGPDGRSRPPLTASHSRDDIVRAADGGFIGVAEDF